MAIVPTWDNVYVNVYNFTGLNSSFPIGSPQKDIYARGVVEYVGPNVDRVSVGQLVVFKQGGYIFDQSTQWGVVSQDAILTIFTSEA